jgi:hypothetical protein
MTVVFAAINSAKRGSLRKAELTVFVHVFDVPVTLFLGFLQIVQRKVRDAGSGVELGENIIVMGLVFGRSKLA